MRSELRNLVTKNKDTYIRKSDYYSYIVRNHSIMFLIMPLKIMQLLTNAPFTHEK